MNVKRLLAVMVLATTLVPSTEVLNAMWCCKDNKRPVRARRASAPAAQSCTQSCCATLQGAVKLLGAAVVGALITYIIVNRPTDINLPDVCIRVMSQSGKLLTNVTENIQPCLSALYRLAENTHRLLGNCEGRIIELIEQGKEMVIAEQEKCNIAARTVEDLIKKNAHLMLERRDLVCANVTGLLSNMTEAVSSLIPAWRPW